MFSRRDSKPPANSTCLTSSCWHCAANSLEAGMRPSCPREGWAGDQHHCGQGMVASHVGPGWNLCQRKVFDIVVPPLSTKSNNSSVFPHFPSELSTLRFSAWLFSRQHEDVLLLRVCKREPKQVIFQSSTVNLEQKRELNLVSHTPGLLPCSPAPPLSY